jgi:hypothetical protein
VAEDAKTPLLVAQGEIDVLNKELELFRRQELKTKKVVETLALQKEQERKAHQVRFEKTTEKNKTKTTGWMLFCLIGLGGHGRIRMSFG